MLGHQQDRHVNAHSSQARLREHHGREEEKDVRPREWRGILYETLSSGHDMGVALTNLQWLWLPAHHQCKIKLAKTLLRGSWQWLVALRGRILLLGGCGHC